MQKPSIQAGFSVMLADFGFGAGMLTRAALRRFIERDVAPLSPCLDDRLQRAVVAARLRQTGEQAGAGPAGAATQ